jgi:tRNA-specific 2-thiouridylase
MAKVAVALSGGVDSSVVAALLKQQGHEVMGFFAKNWSPLTSQSLTDCPWEEDQADAEAVCRHLDIPFRSCNFEKEYWERIIEPMLAGYKNHETPNPDVWCNRFIKFDVLWKAAEQFGYEYLATGHYAQKIDGKLYRGIDPLKDQSYFLSQLTPEQLDRAWFPLGGLTKTEVRQKAEEFGLPTAKKKDSQGLCFIGKLDLKTFLREQIGDEQGSVFLLNKSSVDTSLPVEWSDYSCIGINRPTRYYTIGERAGALVDNFLYAREIGETQVPPLFIARRDGADLYCVKTAVSDALATYQVILRDVIIHDTATPLSSCSVSVRYHQKELVPVASVEGDLVTFSRAQYAVAAGQLAVFFHGDQVVASGVIAHVARGLENNWDPA